MCRLVLPYKKGSDFILLPHSHLWGGPFPLFEGEGEGEGHPPSSRARAIYGWEGRGPSSPPPPLPFMGKWKNGRGGVKKKLNFIYKIQFFLSTALTQGWVGKGAVWQGRGGGFFRIRSQSVSKGKKRTKKG